MMKPANNIVVAKPYSTTSEIELRARKTPTKPAKQLNEASYLSQQVSQKKEKHAILQVKRVTSVKRIIIGLSCLLTTANVSLAKDFSRRAPPNSRLGTSQDCIDVLLTKPKRSQLDDSSADSLYSQDFKSLRHMPASYVGEELKGVRYLDEQERLKCMVGFLDGKIIDGIGAPYDTSDVDQDDVIFVMDHMKRIFISPISPNMKVQHSSLVAGEPVLMAGTISLKQGVPIVISGDSGHYAPLQENMDLFLQYLSLMGVDISQTKIS